MVGSKGGLSLSMTLVISFLLVLVLAPFVFSAVSKISPVPVDSEPEPVGEQVVTESAIVSQLVSSTQAIVKPLPVLEVSEEPTNNVNLNPSANCGDTITTSTTLTTDILNCPGKGIIIGANNIELDCNGFSIKGIGTGIGIYAFNNNYITIKNCIVDSFGYGFYFDSTNNSFLLNNEANNNSIHGFWLWHSSSNNTLNSNIAINNTQAGFALHTFSSNNSFDSNLAQLNKLFGFHLSNSPDNRFTLNIARNNKKSGFQFDHLADNISASSNIAENNLEYGFLLTSSDYDLLTSNRVVNNSLAGIRLQNSQGPPVGNLIYNNFFNNTLNAIDAGNNSWNTTKTPGTNIINGSYLGGNYWSNYNGADTNSDGLGDTNLPYNSNGNIVNGGDYTPLVAFAPSQLCVSPPQGMISWWPGDGNANDISDGNHGSLANGATFTAGMVGQAFSFDGIDDYVEVPDDLSLNITEKITIDAWINVSDVTTTHIIMSKYFWGGYYLRIDSGGIVSFSARQTTQSAPIIQPNVWYHIAGTYDGVEQKIYVNGNLVASANVTGLIPTTNAPLVIGASPVSHSVLFKGLIDELELFNRSLNISEIQAIYNASSAGKCKPIQCDSNITTNTNLSSDLICNGTALNIRSNSVTLDCQGHKITGTGTGYGISVSGKQNIIVKNCIIQNFSTGIYLVSSNSNTLINNTVKSNNYGINIYYSNGNTLTNNTVNSNGYYGIELSSSNSNTLTSNTVNSNSNFGIYVTSSSSNTLTSNTVNSNNFGIYIQSFSDNNILTSNTANSNNNYGISLYYSSSNTLNSNTASVSTFGIYLDSNSNNNILTSNTAYSNFYGIALNSFSNNNILTSNTAISNNVGIQLGSYSNNNTLTSNNANSNNVGIYLHSSSNNNILTSNTVKSNNKGIDIYYSISNTIFNNFFNNTINAVDINAMYSGNNFWNTPKTAGTNIIGGPFLGGNFWSDYNGTDTNGDGLGDTNLPYNSGGNITIGGDFAPLVTEPDFLCGDLDNSGGVDISDLSAMIDYLYISFTPPANIRAADVDASGNIDISDLTLLIDYLYISFTPITCSPLAYSASSTSTISFGSATGTSTEKLIPINLDSPSDLSGVRLKISYDPTKMKIKEIVKTARTNLLDTAYNGNTLAIIKTDGSASIPAGTDTVVYLKVVPGPNGFDTSSLKITTAEGASYQNKKITVRIQNPLIKKLVA